MTTERESIGDLLERAEAGDPEARREWERLRRKYTYVEGDLAEVDLPEDGGEPSDTVSPSKNIFTIARRGSAGNEDQLTELLAYLLEREPAIATALLSEFGCPPSRPGVATQTRITDGRLDLELSLEQGARVVVESKLGSSTDYPQCAKYIAHIASRSTEGTLVLLTKLHEGWPEGIEKLAAKLGVRLQARRWWDVARVLRGTDRTLAQDFAEMLEQEGLVVPGPLKEQDWNESETIPPAATALLAELQPRVLTLSSGYKRRRLTAGRSSAYRSIYCLWYFEGLQVAAGLSASWNDLKAHRNMSAVADPGDGALVSCSVLNARLATEAEQRQAAKEAVAVQGSDIVGSCWGKFPTRAAPAASVLTAPDFLGQVEQVLEYTRETVEHFRRIGYLDD